MNLPRFGIESRTRTAVAEDSDIGQEIHLHGLPALALASLTAACPSVEAKAVGGPSPSAGVFGVRKEFANVVPESNVGGRSGAGGLADWGLVHFKNPLNRFPALDGLAAIPLDLLGTASFASHLVHDPAQIGPQHLSDQCGFSGARDTSDHTQTAQRQLNINSFQVMEVCLANGDGLGRGLSLIGTVVGNWRAKVAARNGFGAVKNCLAIALGHHVPP